MKSYIVLGLGRFGISMAKTFVELGHQVLAADLDEKVVQQHSTELRHTIQADCTSEEFLRSMDVHKFDAAIVAMGSNLQASIMTTVILKELGAKYILAKAQNDFHAKVLYKVGADKVILPEKDMGVKTAHNLVADNFFDLIEISRDYSIMNIKAPRSWCGKTLESLNIRKNFEVNILAVNSEESANVIPTSSTFINEGDTLTIMGANVDLKRLKDLN